MSVRLDSRAMGRPVPFYGFTKMVHMIGCYGELFSRLPGTPIYRAGKTCPGKHQTLHI